MKVAKAHEALTDEDAKRNFELHGNPDGKQSLEVAIGLPTFLLEKENHTLILIVYLVGLVILVPSAVACWYSSISGECARARAPILIYTPHIHRRLSSRGCGAPWTSSVIPVS